MKHTCCMSLARVLLAAWTGGAGSGAFDIDGNIAGTGAGARIGVGWGGDGGPRDNDKVAGARGA